MRGRGRRALEFEGKIVGIAEVPVLSRLVRSNDRMTTGAEVCGGVATGRVVATSDMTAQLAHAQVHPIAFACGETVFATEGRWRHGDDLVEVAA